MLTNDYPLHEKTGRQTAGGIGGSAGGEQPVRHLACEPLVSAEEFIFNPNRSVLGSLNQMRFLLDGRVTEVEDVMLLNPLSVTRWLCHYPVSHGKTFWMADEAMQKRVLAL